MTEDNDLRPEDDELRPADDELRPADNELRPADQGLRQRVTRQSEEAIGKLASGMLENPVVTGAMTAAFETKQKATRAQEVAMGALNLPSASDLERLTRRLRGVSQRLEGIEDGLDRVEQRIDGLGANTALDRRLAAIEERLERIEAALSDNAAGAKPPVGNASA